MMKSLSNSSNSRSGAKSSDEVTFDSRTDLVGCRFMVFCEQKKYVNYGRTSRAEHGPHLTKSHWTAAWPT